MSNSTLIKVLNTDDAIFSVGFFSGFITNFVFRDAMECPLSTIFFSAVSGIAEAVGSILVGIFIPEPFKAIIPVMCVFSALYAQLRRLNQKKIISN